MPPRASASLHYIYSPHRHATNLEETVLNLVTSQPIDAKDWERPSASCRALVAHSNGTMEEICEVLMNVVEDGITVTSENAEWSQPPIRYENTAALKGEELHRAVQAFNAAHAEEEAAHQTQWNVIVASRAAARALGELRWKPASGFLMKFARESQDRSCRTTAVAAAIQVGDTNMLDFAEEVIGDRAHRWFTNSDRYHAYSEVSAYLNEAQEIREKVLQFLMNAAVAEVEFFDEAMLADTTLCAASETWKKSHERMTWLENSPGKGASLEAQWTEKLEAIRALPASERTHVEVHPLRGPAPDLAVTNGPLAPAVEAILKETPSPASPSAVTNAP